MESVAHTMVEGWEIMRVGLRAKVSHPLGWERDGGYCRFNERDSQVYSGGFVGRMCLVDEGRGLGHLKRYCADVDVLGRKESRLMDREGSCLPGVRRYGLPR